MDGHLPRPGKAPCGTCPYRRDVPSGVWDASEYVKLPRYDGEIYEQLLANAVGLFFCHQSDGHLCAGWVACHDMTNTLATRLHEVHPSTYDYRSPVPVFASGEEAAEHGMDGIDEPDARARAAIRKLQIKRGECDE